MPYERQAKESKGDFLKWEAGETKDLTVLSMEGTGEYIHWMENESTVCAGEDCAFCKAGSRRSLRWTVQVLCNDVKLPWSMSNQTFFGVEDVAEMVGALQGLELRVTRHGSGLKTRYSILPFTAAQRAAAPSRDARWYVQEVQKLCKKHNLNPSQELQLLLADVRPELADDPTLTQLAALLTYLDNKVREERGEAPDEDDAPKSAADYF